MKKADILKIIQEILIERHPDLEESMITPEASLTRDLALDDIDVREFHLECELRFEMPFPLERDKSQGGEEIQTVQNAVDYVLKHQ